MLPRTPKEDAHRDIETHRKFERLQDTYEMCGERTNVGLTFHPNKLLINLPGQIVVLGMHKHDENQTNYFKSRWVDLCQSLSFKRFPYKNFPFSRESLYVRMHTDNSVGVSC